MTTTYDLPLPNDEYDGRIVIASTYFGEDDRGALLILLNETAPFYGVAEIEDLRSGAIIAERIFPNIVPAVRFYEEIGGDY